MAFLSEWFKNDETSTTSNFREELDRFIPFIIEKCSKYGLSKILNKRVDQVAQKNEQFQKENLLGLYLSFEQYLITIKLLKPQELAVFRKHIKNKFPHLSDSKEFTIIFLKEKAGEYVMSATFILKVLEKAQKLIGKSSDKYLYKSLENLKRSSADILENRVKITKPMQDSVMAYSRDIYGKLGGQIGEQNISEIYKEAYEEMSDNYQILDGFTIILSLFPEKLLDETQISLLNAEQLRNLLFEKVGSLQYANQLLAIEVKERKNIQKILRQKEESIIKLNEKLEKNVDDLKFSNTELESFSYSLGHDLKAPLRAINGFSKILTNDYSEKLDDEGNRLLHIITSNSKKMGRLIDDLLTYSQMSRKSININTINSGKVIQEYLYENKIESECIHIMQIHNMKADKMLMKFVFGNLIENSLKFTSNEKLPKIEIGSEEKKKHIEFYIKDNGVGFDMKYSHKLFGLFEKLHPETEFSGTGVGLAIVEKIVNRHKGEIWAKSNPKEGATFFFTIPK